MLSHMLDCQLFGVKPWGASSDQRAVARASMRCWSSSGCDRRRARCGGVSLVAALFAVHPLRVESVAWVAERKDVLSAFFGLLTLIAYTKYVTSDKWQEAGKTHTSPRPSPQRGEEKNGYRSRHPSPVTRHCVMPGPGLLRARFDEQADARHAAVRAAAAGLLAAKSNAECGMRNAEFEMVAAGKNSVLRAGGGGLAR